MIALARVLDWLVLLARAAAAKNIEIVMLRRSSPQRRPDRAPCRREQTVWISFCITARAGPARCGSTRTKCDYTGLDSRPQHVGDVESARRTGRALCALPDPCQMRGWRQGGASEPPTVAHGWRVLPMPSRRGPVVAGVAGVRESTVDTHLQLRPVFGEVRPIGAAAERERSRPRGR